MSDDAQNPVTEEQLHGVHYSIRLSIRYHAKQQRFFTFLSRLAKTIILFTATTAGVFGFKDLGGASLLLGMIAGLVTSLEFGFDIAARAASHQMFKRDYSRLEQEFLTLGTSATKGDLQAIRAKISAIEAEEPAHLSYLVQNVQIELAKADDHDDPKYVRKQVWWKKLLMHLMDFPAEPEIR